MLHIEKYFVCIIPSPQHLVSQMYFCKINQINAKIPDETIFGLERRILYNNTKIVVLNDKDHSSLSDRRLLFYNSKIVELNDKDH